MCPLIAHSADRELFSQLNHSPGATSDQIVARGVEDVKKSSSMGQDKCTKRPTQTRAGNIDEKARKFRNIDDKRGVIFPTVRFLTDCEANAKSLVSLLSRSASAELRFLFPRYAPQRA